MMQVEIPVDVRRLVIAARKVAFDCPPTHHALRELDAASEAFAARVPWDDEPEDQAQPKPAEDRARAIEIWADELRRTCPKGEYVARTFLEGPTEGDERIIRAITAALTTSPAVAEAVEVLERGLEMAVLTLAFHGRDRGTSRQEKMLDDLEQLARETDSLIRATLSSLKGDR